MFRLQIVLFSPLTAGLDYIRFSLLLARYMAAFEHVTDMWNKLPNVLFYK